MCVVFGQSLPNKPNSDQWSVWPCGCEVRLFIECERCFKANNATRGSFSAGYVRCKVVWAHWWLHFWQCMGADEMLESKLLSINPLWAAHHLKALLAVHCSGEKPLKNNVLENHAHRHFQTFSAKKACPRIRVKFFIRM